MDEIAHDNLEFDDIFKFDEEDMELTLQANDHRNEIVEEGCKKGANKRSRSRCTVLKRPLADEYISAANPPYQINEKYDVYCSDFRYYICILISISMSPEESTVVLHFPSWPSSYDFEGDPNKVYLAPYGTFTIPHEQFNVRANRYMKKPAAAIKSDQDSFEHTKKRFACQKYPDELLYRPYNAKRRCSEDDHSAFATSSTVPAEAQQSEQSELDAGASSMSKRGRKRKDAVSSALWLPQAPQSLTSPAPVPFPLISHITPNDEAQLSFGLFTAPTNSISQIDTLSLSSTCIAFSKAGLTLIDEGSNYHYLLPLANISGVYPATVRHTLDLLEDLAAAKRATSALILRAAIFLLQPATLCVAVTFNSNLVNMTGLSTLSKARFESVCRLLRWSSADWSVYDAAMTSGRSSDTSLFVLAAIEPPTPAAPVKNIFDLLARVSPPDMYAARVSTRIIQPQKGFDLPTEVVHEVFLLLDKSSLSAASLTCRLFKIVADGIYPGLKLLLYPHQVNSVEWMAQREKRREYIDDFSWRCFLSRRPTTWLGDTPEISVNFISGEVVLGRPTRLLGARGGLLCDEPGLGKTITVLALILKFRGCVASSYDVENDDASERLFVPENEFDGVYWKRVGSASTESSYALRTSNRRRPELQSAVPSPTTLIVVPAVLRSQWTMQIDRHVRADVLNARNVFVDENEALPLPSAECLAKFLVVVTTHKRLATEWRRGKSNGSSSSSLLGIVFYRIAFDEGHSMGRGNLTDSLFMASALLAKSRWLLTGTPTPSDPSLSLSYLNHQFNFLNHPLFKSTRAPKHEVWRKLFSRAFIDGSDPHERGSLRLLVRLLTDNMIRHTKSDIIGIPKPVYRVTRLILSGEEIRAYNSLVVLARANLVLTGLDYTTPGHRHPDSLLNPVNKKALAEVLYNLRMATAGSGNAPLILPKKDAVLAKIAHSLAGNEKRDEIMGKLTELIDSTLDSKLSTCNRCHSRVALLIVTPCAHMYCPDCLLATKDYCHHCQSTFDWDATQVIQPGFTAKPFELDAKKSKRTTPAALQLRLAGEHAMSPDAHDEWEGIKSAKIDHVIQSIFAVQEKHCSEPSKLRRIYTGVKSCPKIIVFSQFKSFLDRLAIEFKRLAIDYADVSFGTDSQKAQALHRFTHLDSCLVLVLSSDGARGLDLSFVTHLLLMDSLLDVSLEQQVISRAYRMGTRHSVQVEFVYSGATIDELIYLDNAAKRAENQLDSAALDAQLIGDMSREGDHLMHGLHRNISSSSSSSKCILHECYETQNARLLSMVKMVEEKFEERRISPLKETLLTTFRDR